MADDASKPKNSIKRFRIGLNVLIQVVLLVVIVCVVNMLSCRKYAQWDFTPSKRYSLGEQTQKVLANLPQDLYLTVAFSRSSDVFYYTQRMIGLYEKEAGGKLKVRWIDPLRDPSAVAELMNQDAKLAFDQNKILISKTEKLEVAGEKGLEVAPYQMVTEKDMFSRADNLLFRDGKSKRGNVTEYRLERALTSAILATTQDRKQITYIITGKGPMRTVAGKSAGGLLMLEGGLRQNLVVAPLPFTPNTKIPEDASTVMMISPSKDFTGAELNEIFSKYWEERKGGLVILLDPLHYDKIPNLRGYLENYYGVRLENDRVLSIKNQGGRNLKIYEAPGWFIAGSPITETLLERPIILPLQSSSISTNIESASEDRLAPSPTDKKTLMIGYDGFWKERDYKSPNPTADQREMDEVNLAVSVEKGAGTNQDLRLNSSRMVVVGNGNLIDPDLKSGESIEFILNSINWASDREELVAGIDVQQVGNYRINVGDRPYKKLEWMALRILPVLVFLIGLVVAFFRRR
jgi:hypothetical protein